MMTKVQKSCLTLLCLLALSGCSPLPPQPPQIETHYVTLPASMVRHFCTMQEIKEGDNVQDLADAYVYNTVCGKKYQAQVDEQKEMLKAIDERNQSGGK